MDAPREVKRTVTLYGLQTDTDREVRRDAGPWLMAAVATGTLVVIAALCLVLLILGTLAWEWAIAL